MLYLLVLIGVATVIAVVWAAAGPPHRQPAPRRIVAPDDDPEFLRRISQRRPRPPRPPEDRG
jgi:hypothetical protein